VFISFFFALKTIFQVLKLELSDRVEPQMNLLLTGKISSWTPNSTLPLEYGC